MNKTKRRYFLYGIAFWIVAPWPANAATQTLEASWIQAYQNNPSLEAQRASLRAVDEAVSQAISHWRPTIDATANFGKTRQYAPDPEFFQPEHFSDKTRSYGMQVTQPLFRGFRTLAETEAAENQVRAGRAQLDAAEQQLFLDTASAYLGVLRDGAILALQHAHEGVLREKLEETRMRSDVGELTITDLRQAESRLARARQPLPGGKYPGAGSRGFYAPDGSDAGNIASA